VRGDVRSFLEATQNERERAVTEKMIWIKSQIKGHDIKSLESSLASKGYRIGLVEDSLVRGTTLREIIKKLRALGAQEVHVFSTYDMIRHPCVYGIDTPEEDKLIAARLKGDVQAIAREIGADSVNYLPWTEYGNAIGVPNSKMCFACVNGNYATDTSEYQAYLKMRKKERESLEKNRKI